MSDDHSEEAVTSPSTKIRSAGRAKPRRSRKVCSHCHARKIRCNVAETNPPCANCVDAGVACHIRRRKNQRREATPVEDRNHVVGQTQSWQVQQPAATTTWPDSNGPASNVVQPIGYMQRQASFEQPIHSPSVARRASTWTNSSSYWDPNEPLLDSASSANASVDFSHLADLDDIFAFTSDGLLPSIYESETEITPIPPYVHQSLNASPSLNGAGIDQGASLQSGVETPPIPGLSPRDQEYLHSEGCFELPPMNIFREMMLLYFRLVHPNLPIVPEDQFWSLWTDGDFRLGDFSFLLVRAMVFSAASFAEAEVLSSLGFVSKREARNSYYRLSKLLFDFEIERDPVASAQACLLLSYHGPNYNTTRVNSSWLTHAARFARIARADSYFRVSDPAKSRLLKRLWWGLLFRDRILSIGLRRTLQIEMDPFWEDEKHMLQADDFQSELGQSPVHNKQTQFRIVTMITATCRLVKPLTIAAKQLYLYERFDDRLDAVSQSLRTTVTGIQTALEALRMWHEQTIREFPFPVSLDDTHDTICIYANMLFSYYSTAIFALNLYLILLRETLPAAKSLFSVDDAREALTAANEDITKRTQELVQVRLIKYLPLTVSAIMALPLVLQAINVAAARGSTMESTEARKLDVFTRTFHAQQQSYAGSDFCMDVLNNIISYAQDDAEFVSAMISWRDGKNAHTRSSSSLTSQNKIKLDWANLVYKRPRLFLRLTLHLDLAFCTGRPPMDDDFPRELRRGMV